ncbi:MAG: hypothetical protein ACMUHM_08065 [Thermoplasmatota archaeon]
MYSETDVLKEILVIYAMDTVVKERRSLILPPLLRNFIGTVKTGDQKGTTDRMFV